MACTVLFVEDDQGVRESTEAILASAGFRMLVAEDAEIALRLLAENNVDVLFTDIVMPGMSGIDLVRLAHERYPHVKTMLMTGYYSRAKEAAQLGTLLFKPARAPEMLESLRVLLAAAPNADCRFI